LPFDFGFAIKMSKSVKKAEELAYEGEGEKMDTQGCIALQEFVLSVCYRDRRPA
jgi:hypothetical protein